MSRLVIGREALRATGHKAIMRGCSRRKGLRRGLGTGIHASGTHATHLHANLRAKDQTGPRASDPRQQRYHRPNYLVRVMGCVGDECQPVRVFLLSSK